MTCTSDVGVDEEETKKMGSRDNDDDENANDMERIRGELCWKVKLELETFKILELDLVLKVKGEYSIFSNYFSFYFRFANPKRFVYFIIRSFYFVKC